jgi:hypothetical protein
MEVTLLAQKIFLQQMMKAYLTKQVISPAPWSAATPTQHFSNVR